MTLEKLLNTLLERGWKPFNREKTLHITIYDCDFNVYLDGGFMNEDKKSFRELVSKESLLWQFVCENEMIKKLGDNLKYFYNSRDELGTVWYYEDRYKYRLIESALCDEDKLEEFLLDNIKIDETAQ